MSRAVCDLTGEATVAAAWDKLFRYNNKSRGLGDVGYKAGQKIAIKPNWVRLIFSERNVDPETYNYVKRQDYMNTSPQMIVPCSASLPASACARAISPSAIPWPFWPMNTTTSCMGSSPRCAMKIFPENSAESR